MKVVNIFNYVLDSIKNTVENSWYYMVKKRKFVYLGLGLMLTLPTFVKWVV